MRMVGNDIYIQRGETFAIDFRLKNDKGQPLVLLNRWKHPYIIITIGSTLYTQEGRQSDSYWLDVSEKLVQTKDGTLSVVETPTFISMKALFAQDFDFSVLKEQYKNNSQINFDDQDNDFWVGNYLFYRDADNDGNYEYAYLKSHSVNCDVWQNYDFRIVKQFDTRDWDAARYLYDIKIVSGQTLQEYITNILAGRGIDVLTSEWTDAEMDTYINEIADSDLRAEVRSMYDQRLPLVNTYDTECQILSQQNIYVNTNVQKGVI